MRANNQVAITLQNIRSGDSTKNSNNRNSELPKTEWYTNAYGRLMYGVEDANPPIGVYEPLNETQRELLRAETRSLALIGKFTRSPQTLPKPIGASCPRLPRVKRFEAKQGQKLREAGAAMDDLIGEGNQGLCRAILLTIPADYQDAWSTVAAYSGWIMKRINNYLGRHLDKPLWFYVWELQGRGALHLHMCFYAPTVGLGERLGDGILQLWMKLLQEMSDKSGNDLFWSGRIKDGQRVYVPREKYINSNQQVKFGVSRYFAKYSGKDSFGSKNKEGKGFGKKETAHPARIWGSSQPLKNRAKEMSLTASIEFPSDESASRFHDEIIEMLKQYEAETHTSYSFDIKAERNGQILSVAQGMTEVFYISRDKFLDALAMMDLRMQRAKLEVPFISEIERYRNPMELHPVGTVELDIVA